jgi:FdhD protein
MNDGGEMARERSGHQWRPGSDYVQISRATPTEAAVGLSFDGRPHTVLMSSPADLEDLAVGFTLTEGIAGYADILGVTVEQKPEGYLVDVRLAPGRVKQRARPRTLEGRSSCGLCGVQRLADAVRPIPVVVAGQRFAPEAIQRALGQLGDRQSLGQLTRATHAAGFARVDGELGLLREDVGRHNALDKLAGGLLQSGVDAAMGFVIVTSRCSFEMVEKAARMGCPMIVAVSAPTDLAIRKAEEAGITLVALARSDGHTIFSGADRLIHPRRVEALAHV